MCLGGAFFARGYEPRQTRFRGGGASLSDLCPASRSRRVITLRALTASRIMDPSPLVPGTLVWARIIYLLGEKSLCRSKQSLVSRPHSVYGPAAERTIDSFLRCRPLTSRRLAQPLRGHGIPSRVIASPYTGTAGASAVGPQPINTSYDTKERKEKGPDVCRAWDCQRALLEQHLDKAAAHAFELHVVVADEGLERAPQVEGGVDGAVGGAEGRHVKDPGHPGHLEHDHVLRKRKHVTSGAKSLDVPWGARGLDWPGFRAGPGAWGGNLARGKSLGTGCA